jgi:hypothetical protein
MNLSRTISLSIFDKYGNEISISTDTNHSIEFFIPRDLNIIIPPMIIQNVTSLNRTNRLFHFHLINLTTFQTNPNLTQSIHIEMHSFNINL